ncbi:HAD family hydrolase [Flavicella sediminum]|uniref:HAD family hydrolase n=1 Tax=Flavicella sediminum TaxID=2585141 RepID=UPI001120E5BF|nr:HAD family phosphatase [Flavicella sediminum]
MQNKITTVVFDLGGVLIDHHPEVVFLKEFKGDQAKTDWFLNTVCTAEWNLGQDAGRTIEEANRLKIAEFPEYEKQILMYYGNWEHMCVGSIEGTLAIFEALKKTKQYKLYALTNFSSETFPKALKLFPYLNTFDGRVVSAEEKEIKPFDKIYQILFERFDFDPTNAVFIDDKLENIEAAIRNGMHGIHFKSPEQLAKELSLFGVSY